MATAAPPSLAAASASSTAAAPSVAAAAAATGSIPNLRDRIPKLQPRRRSAPSSQQSPAPETPSLPPPSTPIASQTPASTNAFATPRRRILSPGDHELFLASPACSLLQAWVFGLADSVVDTPAGVYADALTELEKNKATKASAADEAPVPGQWRPEEHQKIYQKNLPQRPLSPIVVSLLAILDDIEELVYATPPDDAGGSRFGNKRFRVFVDQVRQRAPAWHATLGLDESREGQKEAAAEATAYLSHAFGNRARIDYGSGHELHFVVWLLCLYQLGLFSAKEDMPALALCVFVRYLDVMRVVQTTYYLEPAGSHGVWGLDDYQFLPFLFGAAQLLHHRYITPRAVHQPLTLEQFGDDYQYLGQVRFVNSIKVATSDAPGTSSDGPAAGSANSLRWHSPMLDDISAAKSWEKIEGGMRRMFLAEVLKKLPVMQHFLFGSLVPAAPGMTPARDEKEGEDEEDSEDEDAIVDGNDKVDVYQEGDVRHIHTPSGWGDCCGIRVPSSFGAAGEMRKRGGDTLRRIPFD